MKACEIYTAENLLYKIKIIHEDGSTEIYRHLYKSLKDAKEAVEDLIILEESDEDQWNLIERHEKNNDEGDDNGKH